MANVLGDNPSVSLLLQGLRAFMRFRVEHLSGDEKGQAQVFCDRMFRAFGHDGLHEAGASLEYRIKKGDSKGTAFADLMWKPHCLIEMKKSGTDLSKHYRQAFDYWVKAVPDRPRYVILCNFDEFWVYDFDQQLDTPMDKIPIAQLDTRWEALSFLLKEPQTPIFRHNLVGVTREAAGKVAQVFTGLVSRGASRANAQRFVLQSVMAMFAEDIGLLPAAYFTRAVEDCLDSKADPYDLLFGLFREMNTVGNTAGGRYRQTPYFNGGLFREINPVSLDRNDLLSLQTAAVTDWSKVRPEIFGTLFEKSMDEGERHASGAHFTSQADILRVIDPCIVKPWQSRIESASSISELELLLMDMLSFRVLDPACGSGNFLYVAYREMRRLEVDALTRIADMRRSSSIAAQRAFAYVTPDHFLGIDQNAFAVEIAKVTMMLAKKLSADELDDEQNVLPLDSLDATIVAADALFTPWPEATVIVGNPPYLGRRKMVEELGADYCRRLATRYPAISGVSDFVSYWVPLAHDALPYGGRAGFVTTNTIRQNDTRKVTLDYVEDHGGTIFEAVSSQPWSGDAAVHVSIFNWIKGVPPTTKILWLNNAQLRLELPAIPTSLMPDVDLRTAKNLSVNERPKVCFQGQTPGVTEGFTLTGQQRQELIDKDPRSRFFIYPFIGGEDLLRGSGAGKYIIDLPHDDLLEAEAAAPGAVAWLRQTVLPTKKAASEKEAKRNAEADGKVNQHHAKFLAQWWQLAYRRSDMVAAISKLDQYIALTIVAQEQRLSIYSFVDAIIRPSATLQVFAFDDHYSLGILSSSLHRRWFEARCSTLETRLRYTPQSVFNSFPWPQVPADAAVSAIEDAVAAVLDYRKSRLLQGASLKKIYDLLREPGQSHLRDAHSALDEAVMTAYGFSRDEPSLAQLLALNQELSKSAITVRGPGPLQ